MSEQPPRCHILIEDIGIHWFPSYEENVPCFCGAIVCHVEDEEDTDAFGYEIVGYEMDRTDAPAPVPERRATDAPE